MKRFLAGPILGDLTIIKILPPSDIFHQNTRFPDSSKVIFPSGNSKEFLSSCAVCPLAFYSLGVPHIYWEQGIASIQNLLEAGNNTRWTVICSSLLWNRPSWKCDHAVHSFHCHLTNMASSFPMLDKFGLGFCGLCPVIIKGCHILWPPTTMGIWPVHYGCPCLLPVPVPYTGYGEGNRLKMVMEEKV